MSTAMPWCLHTRAAIPICFDERMLTASASFRIQHRHLRPAPENCGMRPSIDSVSAVLCRVCSAPEPVWPGTTGCHPTSPTRPGTPAARRSAGCSRTSAPAPSASAPRVDAADTARSASGARGWHGGWRLAPADPLPRPGRRFVTTERRAGRRCGAPLGGCRHRFRGGALPPRAGTRRVPRRSDANRGRTPGPCRRG